MKLLTLFDIVTYCRQNSTGAGPESRILSRDPREHAFRFRQRSLSSHTLTSDISPSSILNLKATKPYQVLVELDVRSTLAIAVQGCEIMKRP